MMIHQTLVINVNTPWYTMQIVSKTLLFMFYIVYQLFVYLFINFFLLFRWKSDSFVPMCFNTVCHFQQNTPATIVVS